MKEMIGKVKHFFIDLWLNLSEVLIFIIGIIIFSAIAIIGFFYTFFKHIYLKDYSAKRHFKPLVRIITLANDGLANGCGGEMLNDLSGVKDGEIRYGNWYQTISSVTGLRFIFNNRTSTMRKVLNKIDKDHCELAPTQIEIFYYKSMYTNNKETK